MPLSMRIARVNRIGVNRITRRFAGRFPPFAVVRHRGRRSGRQYETPMMAFRRGDSFVLALTYGAKTDWLQNLIAAGGGELEYGGSRIPIDSPELAGWEIGRELPALVQFALHVIRVEDFLVVRADGDLIHL
jgi:deazaflavin-dependent oxidoreductase (nitroreductase family)